MTNLLGLSDNEHTWLAAYVETQIEPYRRLLTAPALDAMRGALFETLAIHPGTRQLIRRLAPSPLVLKSEELPTAGSVQSVDEQQRGTGTKK